MLNTQYKFSNIETLNNPLFIPAKNHDRRVTTTINLLANLHPPHTRPQNLSIIHIHRRRNYLAKCRSYANHFLALTSSTLNPVPYVNGAK